MFGDFMHVIIDKTKFNLIDCVSFSSRFMGLMFTRDFDYCMRFRKCNSIHTFFMKTNIDVVMTDKDDNVLYVFVHNCVQNYCFCAERQRNRAFINKKYCVFACHYILNV